MIFKQVLGDFDGILKRGENDSYHVNLLRSTIAEFKVRVDQLLNTNNLNQTETITNVVLEGWPHLATEIDDRISRTYFSDESPNLITRIQNLMKCSEFGTDVYAACRNDSSKLTFFAKQVDDFQTELTKWKEYEQLMYEKLISIIDEGIARSENRQFSADWYVPQMIEFKTIFGQMKEHPVYDNDLKRIIESTIHALKLRSDLYKSYRVLEDRQTLRDLLERIDNQIRNDDPETQKKMETLNGIITTNIMLEICMTMANEALEQRVFPFNKKYTNLCKLPANTSSSDAEFVRMALLDHIDGISSDIKYSKSVLNEEDRETYPHYEFNARDPFYVWKYKDFKKEIAKLFRGEEIILNANISNAPELVSTFNAVKYTKILLDFVLVNETEEEQNRFRDSLRHIDVNLVMTGDQHFRCDKRIYSFSGFTDPYSWHYEMDPADGKMQQYAVSGNYDYYMRNDPLLSPFTHWKVRFPEKVTPRDYRQFAGKEVDVLLIGEAYCVKNRDIGQQVCDDLHENFEHDRVVKEL